MNDAVYLAGRGTFCFGTHGANSPFSENLFLEFKTTIHPKFESSHVWTHSIQSKTKKSSRFIVEKSFFPILIIDCGSEGDEFSIYQTVLPSPTAQNELRIISTIHSRVDLSFFMANPTNQSSSNEPRILYCLDFDGVLCDSVHETFLSGWKACKILWSDTEDDHWMQIYENDSKKMNQLEQDFRYVRPILYVGWEAILLIRLLAVGYEQEIAGTTLDVSNSISTRDAVFWGFHNSDAECDFRNHVLQSWGLGVSEYGDAMAKARNTWIQEDEASWIDAHGFYEGACNAVQRFLEVSGNKDVYVITTKAKEFALRLLEKQSLFRSHSPNNITIKENHVYGLGSGPKASVLQDILRARQQNSSDTDYIAVMVEDNIGTLDKISRSPVANKVLPVVATWGYNSVHQLTDVLQAQKTNTDKPPYVILPLPESSSSKLPESEFPEYAKKLKQLDPTGSSMSSILQKSIVLASFHGEQ